MGTPVTVFHNLKELPKAIEDLHHFAVNGHADRYVGRMVFFTLNDSDRKSPILAGGRELIIIYRGATPQEAQADANHVISGASSDAVR